MKAPFLLAALCAGPLGAIAQTTLQIAECDDLPSSITTDTTLQFTAQEISCTNNTHVTVSERVAVEISSVEASTKLNNVKFAVSKRASFLSTVPQLDWTSVETELDQSGHQAAGGAAMRVEKRATATFAEDVTFSACAIPQEDLGGGSGAAIVSLGTLVFAKTATFKDTVDGGALYAYGPLTFEGDVLFENNKHTNFPEGNGSGGGLFIDRSLVQFKGAASFINNEVAEKFQSGGRGAGLYSNAQVDEPMVFSGPVLFKGNRGLQGALALHGSQKVIFESHVTFEDNVMEPTLDVDGSEGGGMHVMSHNDVEFQAGVTATGNSARQGGAFYFDDELNITMSGPVTITDNTAQFGGAVWTQAERLTLPVDADVSSNTATIECPGIQYLSSPYADTVVVEFTDGVTYNTVSEELCYLGSQATATPVDLVENFDCESYVETAPRTDDFPYLVIDTMETKTWNLGTSVTGGLSCPEQLIIYVTGGEELTIISTAASAKMENVRIEVVAYTKLILDVPDFTVTGIVQSQRGGAIVVGAGSSMDVMEAITFMGNTVAYESLGIWPELGGPAVFSEGDVKFYGEAKFLGNGQYRARANGEEPSNRPGGAVLNAGTMQFMKKVTFKDNFNPNGGEGGAIANSGDLTFNVRSIFHNNSVAVAYSDDGQPYNGRGGALNNYGSDGTVVFKGLAVFKNNVGEMGGCALSTEGTIDGDDAAEGDNRVTFEKKAKFKDNFCDGDYPTIYDNDDSDRGGGALLARRASTVVFSDTAVFKRNEAPRGGAITNSATISFASHAKLLMEDNISIDTCPDVENNDEGSIQIGSETFDGPNADVCDRS